LGDDKLSLIMFYFQSVRLD